MFGRKWVKNSSTVPKRPVVINLSTNVQPAHTAIILLTSFDSNEVHKEIEKIIRENHNIIPNDLPTRLQGFGDVFTEWEGILIDVEPQKPMMDITKLGPVS